LEQAERDIVVKDTALQTSLAQLDLRNTLIEELQLQLTTTPSVQEGDAIPHMKILTGEDWVKFRRLFNARFPDFTEQLKSRFPMLTAGETRLFLLIKTGFDTNEIADVLGIAATSVYMSRKRLRKKLDLEQDMDLEGFIQAF
jgi:Bacterial regulatory proteins, luxR family